MAPTSSILKLGQTFSLACRWEYPPNKLNNSDGCATKKTMEYRPMPAFLYDSIYATTFQWKFKVFPVIISLRQQRKCFGGGGEKVGLQIEQENFLSFFNGWFELLLESFVGYSAPGFRESYPGDYVRQSVLQWEERAIFGNCFSVPLFVISTKDDVVILWKRQQFSIS